MQFREAWPRFQLGTRIAATIVLALIAVHALYAVLFLLMPARLMSVYSAHWLVGKAEKATSVIFQEDAQARDRRAAQFGADNHLHAHWQRTWDGPEPKSEKGLRPFLERARASIERDLEGKVRKVAVKGVLELRGNMFHVDLQPQPADFLNRLPLGPLDPGEADLPILESSSLRFRGSTGAGS